MTPISIPLSELETLLRRIVREEVHKELAQLLTALGDFSTEGGEDQSADAALLAEALEESERQHQNPEGWQDWRAFRAQLAAEGKGHAGPH